ncbi:MAG: FHA domain-containing protein [Myxococcaceae bacterium]|nr:FHA domain-containing protein [Myxococcaceae bacterium]
MFTVEELKKLSKALKPAALRKQLGPFVLVQRPPKAEVTEKLPLSAGPEDPTNPWGEPEPTGLLKVDAVSSGTLSLVFQFDTLSVATLPPLQGVDELSVGRQPDCDLVINHASVSKRHATLRWVAEHNRASLQDLGSTNGTYINAGSKLMGEAGLHDGDIISFGEVQFWYLLTETLIDRLAPQGGSKLPRGV